MVKNLPIAKEVAKKTEGYVSEVKNFTELSALLLKNSSELTNKFDIDITTCRHNSNGYL